MLTIVFGQLMLQAQEVFHFELESSVRTMRNPMVGLVASRVAGFQHCALLYLQSKASHETKATDFKWLDNQAYHLADFLALYQALITDEAISSDEQKSIKAAFKEATLAYPCFFDEDENTALQHVNCVGSDLTPFSLDTDWEKAFHSIFETFHQQNYTRQLEVFQRFSHQRKPIR